MEKLSRQLLDCGVASLTLRGESESGDQHLIQPFRKGMLVAVVDGLGHGVEAADAARIAVKTLQHHAGESVISLVGHCQQELLRSRGVVMSIASFMAADSSMTWIGVGNVGGLLVRAETKNLPERELLLLRGGVVGGLLPGLRASVIPVSKGDTLIFATDGVASDFYDEARFSDPPQKIADRVLAANAKGTDDAMVLVARFLGGSI